VSVHDLVTLGEVLLRLAIPSPARVETVRQLDVQIGGAEANVAAAAARLGLTTAWVSAVPDNAWGDRVRRELAAHGVDCRYVVRKPDTRLGVYFIEYGVRPRPIRVLYDRNDSAFARLDVAEVDWEPLRQARVVHLSGITPALGRGPRALLERALQEAAVVSFDVNYRALLWSPAEARWFLAGVLPSVAYLFVGQAEARTIFDLAPSPERTLEALARMAPKAIVTLMRGEEGCLVLAGGRFFQPSRRYPVDVADPVGAGDAYVAGFLWAMLQGRDLQGAVDAGTAVAALKCSTWGDIALVDARDVADLLAGGPDVRR
jgi:2-dehydro-3-deoxygluconokinase